MNELKGKSPWEKPGGTLAKITLVAMIAGAGYALYKFLPDLIALTQNLLTLTALVGVLALIFFLIMNDTSRNFFKNLYFVIMRKLTGLIVEIDPIAIVKGKIKDMKNRLVKIEEGITKMRGIHVKNEKALEANKRDLEESLKKLQILQKQNKMEESGLLQRHISQLDESVKKRTLNFEKSKQMIDILTKVKKSAEIKVKYTEEEIKLKEEDYELMKANHKALSSIKSLINPQTDDAFDMAMEKMDTDITLYIGEMDEFLESGVIDDINLDNALSSVKSQAILDKYNKGGFDAILGEHKEALKLDSNLGKLQESSNKLSNKYF
ncbi:MAG: hypothetical protein IKR41_12880 [Bacteroidales bacterium]|jgi:hypothetical protein|nr:hypothetical protein [Bacteroidales bacterium]